MKKKFQLPSAYTILILLIIFVAVLTFIIPAGQYDYVDPNAAVPKPIPGSYHSIEQTPQGITDIIMAPIYGFKGALDVILFLIVIGGFLGIVMKTGAINAGIGKIVQKLQGKEIWMIPILMTIFALGGSTYGMAEETIPFYPILIPIFIAAGYDVVTAAAVLLIGCISGVLASTINPFSIGVGSNFAGISISAGIGIRLVLWIVTTFVSIFYVMRYAKKVKKDPSKSIVANIKNDAFKPADMNDIPELTGKRKVVLWIFGITFVLMIYGIMPLDSMGITFVPTLNWFFDELSALFLVSGILIGLIYRLKEKELVSCFIAGSKDLLGVALIIGLSRGITVLMNNGHISETLLNYGETGLSGVSSYIFSILSFVFYLPLSFLIPSSSALGTLVTPIMAPMADFAGVARHVEVMAYTMSSGLVNLLTPTSGLLMGGLALAGISLDKWFKFIWKYISIMLVVCVAILIVGTVIG